jgi:hypothetical protein
MTNLKRIEGKTIKSISENNDGTNSYLIIKFEEGGKLNIVAFLRGDKGVAQLDVDLGGLTPEKLIGKRILAVEEEFDGEQDHINFTLRGGHKIKITSYCSSPVSTASLEATLYSGDNIVAESNKLNKMKAKFVAESLRENTYQQIGQYQMSKPQYESDEDYNPYAGFTSRVILVRTNPPGDENTLMDIYDLLNDVYMGVGISRDYDDGVPLLEIEDDDATVEDVSDALAEYIQNGQVDTVDEETMPY